MEKKYPSHGILINNATIIINQYLINNPVADESSEIFERNELVRIYEWLKKIENLIKEKKLINIRIILVNLRDDKTFRKYRYKPSKGFDKYAYELYKIQIQHDAVVYDLLNKAPRNMWGGYSNQITMW